MSRTRPPKIVVIGDVMLDHYLWGTCDRVSPEAPVQVVNVTRETFCLGGAANVVANLASLGAAAELVGVVGDDHARTQLCDALAAANIGADGLFASATRRTTVKQRVLAGAQQIVRLDHETVLPLSNEAERQVIAKASAAIETASVVVISDYGKGVLTEHVTREIIKLGRARCIPVLVDPKGRDYSKYRGATIATPNRREAALATGLTLTNRESIGEAGRKLRKEFDLEACLITLSEGGLALFEANRETLLVTEAREVFDVTGAGDTLVAALAVALACGHSLVEAARFANAAAGVVVGKVGAATVTLQEIERSSARSRGASGKIVTLSALLHQLRDLRALKKRIVFTNGCFDVLHAGHVRYLEQAATLGDALIVGLNSDESIKRLKGPLRPINALDDRALVLATLGCVGWVVPFAEDTPLDLVRAIQPDVIVKGGDYRAEDVVGADVVRERGGTVEILPLLPGRSTTRLIQRVSELGE